MWVKKAVVTTPYFIVKETEACRNLPLEPYGKSVKESEPVPNGLTSGANAVITSLDQTQRKHSFSLSGYLNKKRGIQTHLEKYKQEWDKLAEQGYECWLDPLRPIVFLP